MVGPKPTTAEERAEMVGVAHAYSIDPGRDLGHMLVTAVGRLLADLERAEVEVVRLDQNIDAEVASLRADLARAREMTTDAEAKIDTIFSRLLSIDSDVHERLARELLADAVGVKLPR